VHGNSLYPNEKEAVAITAEKLKNRFLKHTNYSPDDGQLDRNM
jgi:hypothetical protein